MKQKLKFIFGIHSHQPIGNFDHVIDSLTSSCYLPFLKEVKKRPFFKMAVHFSGILLSWLDKHRPEMIELLAELVQSDQVELLTGGFYEPVLVAVPREDRLSQIKKLQEFIAEKFGRVPKGLWLTERAWEPQVTEALIDAGISYVIVDDRHFLISGFDKKDLHAYYLTEAEGKRLAIFPVDEHLRYLIPFNPPADPALYLKGLQAKGHSLSIYVDDGEKFGGWPGTKKWVYEDGWLDQFFNTIEEACSSFITMATPSEVMETIPPAGLAYLSTASYREMEEWSLPATHVEQIEALKQRVGPDWKNFSPYIRGGHWRNFFIKYPESNLLHKKMLFLRKLHNKSFSDRMDILDHIHAAQCNDAYWHGVFGGLYLPHLRHALWERLILAEQEMRKDTSLTLETIDIDYDGKDEICAYSPKFSAIIKPGTGGQLLEFSDFNAGINLLNTVARYKESYHAQKDGAEEWKNTTGIASIHDIPKDLSAIKEGLEFDSCRRSGMISRFFPFKKINEDILFDDIGDFADQPFSFNVDGSTVAMRRDGRLYIDNKPYHVMLRKSVTFTPEGSMIVIHEITNTGTDSISCIFGIEWNWFPYIMATGKGGLVINGQDYILDTPSVCKEVSTLLFTGKKKQDRLTLQPENPTNIRLFPVRTVYQTEQGFESVLQAISVTPFWRINLTPSETWKTIIRISLG
ncbi:MAG: alpha-amylase/4-alpha-glucanotransferase domain-containing protein [Pseudomonadota bacterium]